MPEFKEFPPNTFCWPELATSDTDGAKKFYAEVFGWEYEQDPVGPDAVYIMGNKAGKYTCGMFALNEEMKSQGVPPNWLSYVSVSDVDETASKAKTLGATVLREPMDVMDAGRMAVLQDPTGAVFALWQPKKSIGSQLANEPGSFTWNELMTTNIDEAGKFYTDLFNWSAQTADMGGFDYTSFVNGERPAAGMMEIDQATMGDIPPHWMVYFAVEDCDAAAAKIKSHGGNIVSPPKDIPEVGRFAVALDPQCAAFSIITLLNPQS